MVILLQTGEDGVEEFQIAVTLVSDRALDTDQGQKIVYVVNEKNEVVSQPIRVGALHDGLRAIEDGLKSGERVIVNGLQQVRPGITVEPNLVDMPGQNPKSVAPNPQQIHHKDIKDTKQAKK